MISISSQYLYAIPLLFLLFALIGLIRGNARKIIVFYNYFDFSLSLMPAIIILFPVFVAFITADRESNFSNFFEMFKLYNGERYLALSLGITMFLSLIISIIANRALFSTLQSWCAKMFLSMIFLITIPIAFCLNILAIILFFGGGFVFVGARNKRKYERQSSFNKKMGGAFLVNIFLTFFVIRWFIRTVLPSLCERHTFW